MKTVQAWERGKSDPYRRLSDLERSLGVSRDWLLTGSTARQPGALAAGTDERFQLQPIPINDEHAEIAAAPNDLENALYELQLRVTAVERQLTGIQQTIRALNQSDA
jgi:hypothetical protein